MEALFEPREALFWPVLDPAAQRAAIVTRNIHVILSGSGVYGLLDWVVFVYAAVDYFPFWPRRRFSREMAKMEVYRSVRARTTPPPGSLFRLSSP